MVTPYPFNPSWQVCTSRGFIDPAAAAGSVKRLGVVCEGHALCGTKYPGSRYRCGKKYLLHVKRESAFQVSNHEHLVFTAPTKLDISSLLRVLVLIMILLNKRVRHMRMCP